MSDDPKQLPAEELSEAKIKENKSLGVRIAEGIDEWGIPLVAKIVGGVMATVAYFAKAPMINKRNDWVREGLDIQERAKKGEFDDLPFDKIMELKDRQTELMDNIEGMDALLSVQPWVVGVGVGLIVAGFIGERAIGEVTARRGKKAMYKKDDAPFPDVFERSERTVDGETSDYYFIPLDKLSPDSNRTVEERFEIYKAAFDRRFGIEIHLADDPDKKIGKGEEKFAAFKVEDLEGNIGAVQKMEYIGKQDKEKMLADNIEPTNRQATAGAAVIKATLEKATGTKWSGVDKGPDTEPHWETTDPVAEEKRKEFASLVQDALGLASGVKVRDDGRVSVESKHLTDFNVTQWLGMKVRMADVQKAFSELNGKEIG